MVSKWCQIHPLEPPSTASHLLLKFLDSRPWRLVPASWNGLGDRGAGRVPVLVPFRFQCRPTENNADRHGSRLLGLIPGGYVVLRTLGGRLGLLTNQLLSD